jgi:hypothetical protein
LSVEWGGLALAVGVALAGWLAYRAMRRAGGVEDPRLRERRARLQVAVRRDRDPWGRESLLLRLTNHGPAAAREIRLRWDGTDLQEHPAFSLDLPAIPRLDAGAELAIPFAEAALRGLRRAHEVQCDWRDDSPAPASLTTIIRA